MNKEAPLLNLYINIDLYKVNIDVDDKPGVLSCVINAYPRANARAWAYNIGAEGISVKSQEAVKLDGDDYLLVQLTREEQLNV